MPTLGHEMTRPSHRPAPSAVFPSGLLGDTPGRDYSRKLNQFNAFAERELRGLIEGAGLSPGMRILDAGCGTGEALSWLLDQVKPSGEVVGIDLSAPHAAAAAGYVCENIQVIHGDLLTAPLEPASFDFIWCVNTINHFRDPIQGANKLVALLRSRGRIALGQSSFLPDMIFAWDSRLERVINEAVRCYYCERYSLSERDLASIRALVGVLRGAGVKNVAARTIVIERVSPVDAATERYLVDTIFTGTWRERLRPYLSPDDYEELAAACDPLHANYALARNDFHFIQTFTLVTGGI